MTEACSELGAPSANAAVPKPKVGSKAAQSATLLRRQDDALLSSQSNLDHVTRLKFEIFLCDKAFRPFSPFLMMAICGLPPLPRTSCDLTSAVY